MALTLQFIFIFLIATTFTLQSEDASHVLWVLDVLN